MGEKRPSKRELVESLADAIRHDEPANEQELNERIRDMGYNPAELAKIMRARIKLAIWNAKVITPTPPAGNDGDGGEA